MAPATELSPSIDKKRQMSEDMHPGRPDPDRLDRLESYQAIQQLAVRYALAVDSKDLGVIAALFVSM